RAPHHVIRRRRGPTTAHPDPAEVPIPVARNPGRAPPGRLARILRDQRRWREFDRDRRRLLLRQLVARRRRRLVLLGRRRRRLVRRRLVLRGWWLLLGRRLIGLLRRRRLILLRRRLILRLRRRRLILRLRRRRIGGGRRRRRLVHITARQHERDQSQALHRHPLAVRRPRSSAHSRTTA